MNYTVYIALAVYGVSCFILGFKAVNILTWLREFTCVHRDVTDHGHGVAICNVCSKLFFYKQEKKLAPNHYAVTLLPDKVSIGTRFSLSKFEHLDKKYLHIEPVVKSSQYQPASIRLTNEQWFDLQMSFLLKKHIDSDKQRVDLTYTY